MLLKVLRHLPDTCVLIPTCEHVECKFSLLPVNREKKLTFRYVIEIGLKLTCIYSWSSECIERFECCWLVGILVGESHMPLLQYIYNTCSEYTNDFSTRKHQFTIP